jgi:predicted site-specific integrase-resolvase
VTAAVHPVAILADVEKTSISGVPRIAALPVDRKSSRNEGRALTKIGYARVSTEGQNLDRQIAALRAEGCDRIYREKASGRDVKNRLELAKAIDALATKGVLVLAEWDRATRSLIDGIEIMNKVHKREG